MRVAATIGLGVGIVAFAATMYAAPHGSGVSGRAEVYREQMQRDYLRVLQMQETARHEKDVIKLNCVNDKLVEIKPQLNVADRLAGELSIAPDAAGSLQALAMTAEQVHQARFSAEQCVGMPTLAVKSSNDYTHPTDLDNPVTSWGGTFSIEPPAYASPYY